MRLLSLSLALLCAAPAAAAVSVSASLSRNRIGIDEQPVLSVTVSGDQASLPSPRLPTIEGFNVYDTGRSQSLSFVNGHVASSVVYTYALTPRGVGKFQIPPISADGAPPTAPLDIEVVKADAGGAPLPPAVAQLPGGMAPGPGAVVQPSSRAPARARARGEGAPDVFVTASVDRPRAFVNQQVTLTVRFMTAIPLIGDLRYDAPAMTGFLAEDLPPVRNGMISYGGRNYQYSEIKVALFPVSPGKLTIGTAAVHGQIPRLAGGAPQDFFDRFFSMAAPEPVTVNTDPVTVQVDALPEPKPESFTGVVGRLEAKASADRTSVKAGEAATLTVTLSGTGNLKSAPEPRKPDLPSLRFFETESTVKTDKAGDRVGGTKTYRTVVVPRVSGQVTIPAFAFSYLDPQTKSYVESKTAPIVLQVAPGAPGTAAPLASPSPSAEGLTAIGDDIRYLKVEPRSAPASAALAAFADLGPWHALPFAVLLAAAFLAWRRRAAGADPSGRRFREAYARAETRLKAAAALPAAEAARAAALTDEALTGFVADKIGAPAAGLTLKTALEGLKALRRPPSAATLERLCSAWEEAGVRRFAPNAAGDGARSFAEHAAALLKALDEEVRR